VYLGVFEVCAFDFLYILFAILSAIYYLDALEADSIRRTLLKLLASWISFVAALTSKEPIIVLPFFLATMAIIVILGRDDPRPVRHRFLRAFVCLVPFLLVIAAYSIYHVIPMKAAQTAAIVPGYRTQTIWPSIFENARKYPLWIARIFWHTGDRLLQDVYHNNLKNNLARPSRCC